VSLCAGGGLAAFPQTPAPSPTPPAWQTDLAAAHAIQTAASAAPSGDPTAADARQNRLAEMYRELAAKYPGVNPVQRAAGDYFDEIGSTDIAVDYWQRAEMLDPKDAVSAEALGSAALARGDVREAQKQFQHAVDANPGEATYHFDLANVLYLFRHQVADPPGAEGSEAALVSSLAQFRAAADLAPLDARLAQAYAETFYLLAKPDWSSALAAWQRVLALNASNPDFANGNLARVSLHLGRADDADKYLDAIRDPRFGDMKAKLHAQAASLREHQTP
jgi:tetratricopeptide (TPR) repeat protein